MKKTNKRKERVTLDDLYLLSSLISGEKYGLELIKTVKEEAGKSLNLGSLYNILNRLEKNDFVKSSWGEATIERGGNRRRYYKITASGRRIVNENQVAFNKLWQLGVV